MGDSKDAEACNWHGEKEEVKMPDQFPSNNPNPVLRVDRRGTVLYANKAASPLTEYWGCREGEKLPQSMVDKIRGILSQKNPEQFEINTEKRTYSVTFCSLPEENCVDLYGFDISPFRKAEEELKKKCEEFEESAGKRNLELTGAEEALRNTVSFLETLLDDIPSPVFQRDLNGTYLNCNETFARQIMGLPKEKVIGGSFAELHKKVLKELAGIYRKHDMELLEKGGTHYYETRVVCADGITRDFLFHKAAYKDSSGNVSGIAGVMLDMTQCKAVEETFRKGEERYRIATEQTGQLVYDYDLATGRIDWVGAIKELVGYTFEEMQKMNLDCWIDHIHPEDRERAWKTHKMCMKTGDKYLEEYRFRRKDGTYFHVEDRGFYFKDESGRIFRLLGVMKDISERKLVQETLEKSEERFRAVVERTGQLVYDYDLRTNRSIWAGAIEELTGYSYDEFQKFIPEVWAEHLHPEDRQMAVETYKKCLATGEDFYKEYRLRRKDGSYFYAEDNGFYLKDKDGKVYRTAGVIKDITERKLAREKLEKSEEKYRQAAEQTGQIVFENDLKSGIIDWAGAIQELTGYSAEEFQKFDLEKWAEHVHPEDRKRSIERIMGALEKGERFVEEYRFRRKDGDYFYVESCGQILKDEKGCPCRSVGRSKERAGRKRARPKLEESEEKYRNATEQTGQIVFEHDLKNEVIYWAGAIQELTGYSAEEFQKFDVEKWAEHVHPEDRKRAVERINEALEKGGRIQEEYRFRRKDGDYFYVESCGQILKDEKGCPCRIIGVKKDITEQKLAREKLEKSEERYRLIAEHTGQVLYHDNYTKGVIEWGGAIPEITGYGFEEFQEITVNGWVGLIHPEDRERVTSAHEQCRKEGGDFFEEYRLRRKDGSYVTVEDEGIYLRDENGNICKALGIIKDIGEKKLAQRKLEESEERFRVAAEQTGQIVFEHDHVNDILSWAGAITEVTGYSIEEFRKFDGKMWAEHIHPEDRGETLAKLREFQKSCNRFRVEYRFRKKDGNYFHVEDSGVYLRDDEGHIRKAIGVLKDITLIKLAAEKLQESEERFRVAAEKTGQLIYDFNINSEHVKWAGAIEEITGYTYEEIRKLTTWNLWKEHVHPEDYGNVVSHFGKSLRSGGSYCQEYRFKQNSGNYIYVEDCGTYLRDKKGRVYRMIGVIKDITERKLATEELRKSEERFRIVAEETGQLVYDYDLLRDELGWAGAIKELTDYSLEEFGINCKADWEERLHPEDRRRAVDSFKKCLETGERYHEEYRLRKKDGSYFYVENRGVFLKDEKGRMSRMLGTNKDITQIKHSLDKVRESEEKYRSFMQNFKGIAFQSTLNFVHIFMHGALEEITGYREEQFTSGEVIWEQIIEPEDLARLQPQIAKISSTPGIFVEEVYRIRHRDGSRRWVHEIVQHIPGNEGKLGRLEGAIYDITERKEAEETLARIEKIRMKEIHHRIKNNLQVISSLLELQADHFSEEKVVEAFRESQNRVASMAIIHEELYKGGGTETIDFAAYLRKLTSDLLRSYMVRKEDVKLKLDVEEIFLGMDAAIPLGIIVNELVSNALKHAFPAGRKGEIHVKLFRNEISGNKSISNITNNNGTGSIINKGHQFTLIVSDNGLGFPENIDFTNTDSLGLQLVNTLVEQLEGTIELEGNGRTLFRIKFLESGH